MPAIYHEKQFQNSYYCVFQCTYWYQCSFRQAVRKVF